MRVGFIAHSGGLGGAEYCLLELLEGFLKRGVECFVILPRRGKFVEELKSRKIPHFIIPYTFWCSGPLRVLLRFAFFPLSLVLSTSLIALKMRHWKVDFVYTNTIMIPYGAFASFLIGRPHIWHIHEFGKNDHNMSFILGEKLSTYLMERLSSRIVVNSYAVQRYYKKRISLKKLHVVYYSIRLRKTPTVSKSTKSAVIVGQIKKEKGQIDALHAVLKLLRKRNDVKLYVVGNGKRSYIRKLKKMIPFDKKRNIIFTGWLDNPFRIMASANVFLMCSRSEAFGRVTLEAMILKKPVIGARCGATPELIKNSFNGLLYTPGNYNELAKKLEYLFDHPQTAKRLGRNGHNLAKQKFTEENYAGRILVILKDARPKLKK